MAETLEELQDQQSLIEDEIEEIRRCIQVKRKELLKLEDKLLDAKERGLKVVSEIHEFQSTRDLSILIDHHRETEIETFRTKVPALLAQLDEEERKG